MTEVPYLNVVPLQKVEQGDGPPEVNQPTIEHLEMILELAKKGEIVGVAVVPLHSDNTSGYGIAGRVGGYGMVGALSCVISILTDINRGANDA